MAFFVILGYSKVSLSPNLLSFLTKKIPSITGWLHLTLCFEERKMTSEKNYLMRSLEGVAGLLLFSLWRVFFLVVLLSFLYPPSIPKQLPDFKPQLMWETLLLPELHSVFSSVKKGLTHCLAMTTLTSVSYYYQINLHLFIFLLVI